MLFSIGSMLYLLHPFSYWIITKQYLSSDYKLPFSSTRLIRPLALILNQTIKGLFQAKFHNFIWSIVEVNLVQTKSVSAVTFLIRGTLETRFLVFFIHLLFTLPLNHYLMGFLMQAVVRVPNSCGIAPWNEYMYISEALLKIGQPTKCWILSNDPQMWVQKKFQIYKMKEILL